MHAHSDACTIPMQMCKIKMWAYMHILIYLSAQKYHLTHILHTTKLIKMFCQLSWKKKKTCSESLEPICLDGVRKQNKTYSFEVSIGLLPSFDCHEEKTSPVVKVWSRFILMESRNGTKHTVLKLYRDVNPPFDCHTKQALFWKFGPHLFRWSWETEQNVQFWS